MLLLLLLLLLLLRATARLELRRGPVLGVLGSCLVQIDVWAARRVCVWRIVHVLLLRRRRGRL